jgi:hypothetical protein
VNFVIDCNFVPIFNEKISFSPFVLLVFPIKVAVELVAAFCRGDFFLSFSLLVSVLVFA